MTETMTVHFTHQSGWLMGKKPNLSFHSQFLWLQREREGREREERERYVRRRGLYTLLNWVVQGGKMCSK